MLDTREWKLQLDVDQILRAQGADPDVIRSRRPALVDIASWALQEGMPLLQPRVVWRNMLVSGLRHERLEVQTEEGERQTYFFSGPLIAQHFGAANRIICLVCTVGGLLEELASEVMVTDPLQGWALDSLGSAAVEALAVEVCNRIEAQAALDSLKTTIPLSPGMLDWPVDQGQTQIFACLDARSIGVSMNASFQMVPRKSLSMVVGVGANVGSQGRTCDYCSMSATCKYQNHYARAQSD